MPQKTSNKIFLFLFLLLAGLLLTTRSLPVYAATDVQYDFESGRPADWFEYFGGGAVVTPSFPTIAAGDPLARPGQVGDNGAVQVTFDVTAGFGGMGADFTVSTGPQDWSTYTGVSFWFYGSGSGQGFQFEIFDNGPDGTNAERFDTVVIDDVAGWQQVVIPFADFSRATDFQPGGAPDDGLTLTQMWGFAVILDGAAGTLLFDDIGLEQAIVDDFESGLPSGVDADGVGIGFVPFQDPNSTVGISTTTTPPAPVPGKTGANSVLQMDADVVSFAGFAHAFEDAAVANWVPQDWSGFQGLNFWLYGQNSGTDLFIDLIDNRNPGSTSDDAERFTVAFMDDFSGWRFFELPFADFTRKEIGNGAPNDGLTLTQVHGWAFGALNTGGPLAYYLDDVGLYGVAEIPELAVTFTNSNFDIPEGATGSIVVKLNRPLGDEDPAQVSVDYASETIVAVAGRDFEPSAGTLVFVNGGPSEQSFPLVTLDDTKYEGTERVILRLSNPVDVALGFITQASASIIDSDAYDPNLLDDFERFPDLWESSANVTLTNPEIPDGDAMALPDQGAFEGVLAVEAPLAVDIAIQGRVCNQGNGVIPVKLLSNATFDATAVDHTTVTLGAAYETHVDRKTGVPRRHESDLNGDGLEDLLFHFRFNETGLPCDPDVVPFNGETYDGQPITAGGANAAFGRTFAIGQDWSASDGLTFYYYGQGTGDTITVELQDNRAPDPGPSGWSLAWSDEFDDPAGTPPNPNYWTYEIGDGTVNGIPGWGNDELQYYTDSTDNVSTDGNGNLVITVREADGSLLCYYGPCEYTSARLISWYKAEFAYGRIESRILVPDGDAGLWPAFWSLGTDIDVVDWPQTGEIDIMEYVSRLPDEIFGTIHGPGYSGGASYGNTYPFPGGVSADYHTFTIEWQPDLIEWYVDDILYHTATPADVAPNPWVFNDPVFLLFNMAVGGNFGGAVSDLTTFPQSMAIDYVRVYQGPDTAERFETSFVDDFVGWQEVEIPFASFVRSAEQPAGAPDDGLGLNEVWGYGFRMPDAGSWAGSVLLDQVRLQVPTEVTVTNLNDGGPGSLRDAINRVANGGSVFFDPSLAGGTVPLSGPIAIPAGRQLTIDAAAAPGLTLDGGGADRVLIVDGGATATVKHLTLTNGYGYQLAGGVLNNGTLTLDHVAVTNNTMTTDAGDFWQGGGGIYNGDGAVLNLVDSAVIGNNAGWSGGGIYSFFNTTTNVLRSTISGNVSNDVGGGLRLLGNADIGNSTISGNESTGWYGGAMFITDGVVNMTYSTVAENISPSAGPAAVFVGTFGDTSATLNVGSSIIANNVTEGCFLAPFGGGAVAINSLGNNVFTDATCFAGGTDQIVGDAGLGPLADNGGPTWTHALLPGSPAIDTGDNASCPATDQRGVTRDAACDAGAFEYVP